MSTIDLVSRKPKYWIGDIVFLRICDERKRGLVVGVLFRERSEVYAVVWPDGIEKYHALCELSSEYIPDYVTEVSDATSTN